MGRKFGLIIGNSNYQDSRLAQLAVASQDATRLAEVLKQPEIGEFDDVGLLINETEAVLRRVIGRFFGRRQTDDLLLVYFSGHGVLDDQGMLHFAVADTEHDALSATAISAQFIRQEMDRCYSRRQVLVLDCCYSGAFSRSKTGIGSSVGTASAFTKEGFGRVVLTATDAMQYAWEDQGVTGEASASVFTRYLVEGLQTGAADRNEDGVITLDELYEYVYENVIRTTPKQIPQRHYDEASGAIHIAKSPVAKYAALPRELRQAFDNPYKAVRQGAAKELELLLRGREASSSRSALAFLTERASDKSLRGSDIARRIVASWQAGHNKQQHMPNSVLMASSSGPVIDTLQSQDQAAGSTSTIPRPKNPQRRSPLRREAQFLPTALTSQIWQLPNDKVLNQSKPRYIDDEYFRRIAQTLERTLSMFNLPVYVLEVNIGSRYAWYLVEPASAWRQLNVNRNSIREMAAEIASLSADIALALVADVVRVEFSLQGHPGISIGVAHKQPMVVTLESVLRRSGDGELMLALGEATTSEAVHFDLVELPHLLIAGSNGTGKSACLRTILAGLLVKNTPGELRLIVADFIHPFQTVSLIEGLPHLLSKVIDDPDVAVAVLKWLLNEANSRLTAFGQAQVHGLKGHNNLQLAKPSEDAKALPYIVLVVDGLHRWIASCRKEQISVIRQLLPRLARVGKAAGIHLVFSTEVVARDTILRGLRADFPARAALAVPTVADSKWIIERAGAEKLNGPGDMLLLAVNSPEPTWLQFAFVNDEELIRLVKHWNQPIAGEVAEQIVETAKPDAANTIQLEQMIQPVAPVIKQEFVEANIQDVVGGTPDDIYAQLLDRARIDVRKARLASVVMLQRNLGIDSPTAIKLMVALEEEGVIAPSLGSKNKPRAVVDFGDGTPNSG